MAKQINYNKLYTTYKLIVLNIIYNIIRINPRLFLNIFICQFCTFFFYFLFQLFVRLIHYLIWLFYLLLFSLSSSCLTILSIIFLLNSLTVQSKEFGLILGLRFFGLILWKTSPSLSSPTRLLFSKLLLSIFSSKIFIVMFFIRSLKILIVFLN